MDTNIILVYCLCDELLKWQHRRDDPQCTLNDAEIMTIAIVAAMYFHGNQAMACLFRSEQGYIKHTMSRSRLCRRLARVKHQFLTLFHLLGEEVKVQNDDNIYLIDSMPVAVCDNYRIRRCKIYQDEAYCGYQASKRRYFFGLKIHLVSPKRDNQSISSCRLALSAIQPPSTSLTSTSHRKRGSSVTRHTTATSLKRSWLIATCFSYPCAKTTQNAHTQDDCATCSPPTGKLSKLQAVRSNDSCPNIFMPSRQMASNSRLCFSS